MEQPSEILQFNGDYAFLSNFYPAEFVWDNIVWKTSEHAYQAAKVIDRKYRLMMSNIPRPGDVKHLGKMSQCRDDWESVKIDVMYDIVYQKFVQNPTLKQKLLETGQAHLEEGNSWRDQFWGVCPVGSGEGRNELGKVLMRVRHELSK